MWSQQTVNLKITHGDHCFCAKKKNACNQSMNSKSKKEVAPGLEPGSAESESAVITNYTTQPVLLCLASQMWIMCGLPQLGLVFQQVSQGIKAPRL